MYRCSDVGSFYFVIRVCVQSLLFLVCGFVASVCFAGRVIPNGDSLHARFIPAAYDEAAACIGVEGFIEPAQDHAPALLALNQRVDFIIRGAYAVGGENPPVHFLMRDRRGGRPSVYVATAFELVRIRLQSLRDALSLRRHQGRAFIEANSIPPHSLLGQTLRALDEWIEQMYEDHTEEYGHILIGREDDVLQDLGEEELGLNLIEADNFFHAGVRLLRNEIPSLQRNLQAGMVAFPAETRPSWLLEVDVPTVFFLWTNARGDYINDYPANEWTTWARFFNQAQHSLLGRLAQQALFQARLCDIFVYFEQIMQDVIRRDADPFDEGLGSIYERVLDQLQRLYRLVRLRRFMAGYNTPGYIESVLELQRLIFEQIAIHLLDFTRAVEARQGDSTRFLIEQRALELRADAIFAAQFPYVQAYDINEDFAEETQEESDEEESGEESSDGEGEGDPLAYRNYHYLLMEDDAGESDSSGGDSMDESGDDDDAIDEAFEAAGAEPYARNRNVTSSGRALRPLVGLRASFDIRGEVRRVSE